MLKQTLRLVSYLLLSLIFGIIVTLTLDQFENVAVEKNLRKALEMEIRNAAASFKGAAHDVSPEEVVSFIKGYASMAMRDKILAVDRTLSSQPSTDEFKFLFTFAEQGRSIDFYIKNSFLEDELAVLDTPELIFGVFATIVAFTSIVIYIEKKRQTKQIQQQFELEHAELRKALQEHEALAMLGKMSATLAHELKTPLATISNLVQTLPSRVSDETFIKRFITMTKEEVERMQQLMDNLLIYGKQIDVKHEEWIEFKSFLKTLSDKNHLKTALIPEGRIFGDKFYMALLFENLLRNSRAAGADGIIIRVSESSGEGSFTDVFFEDNGRGFPKDAALGELMDPFITWRPHGAGLGLYLVRKIASSHDGNVSLYRLDGGAGVKISFPKSRIKLYA
jgi:signal transduction histidine kinase